MDSLVLVKVFGGAAYQDPVSLVLGYGEKYAHFETIWNKSVRTMFEREPRIRLEGDCTVRLGKIWMMKV